MSGAVQIGGLLNAETVEISANRAVHISAIGGGTIRVLQTVEYGENLEAEPGTVSRSTQTGAK